MTEDQLSAKDIPGAIDAWWEAARLAWRAWPAGAVGRLSVTVVVMVMEGLAQGFALGQILAHPRGAVVIFWVAVLGLALLGELALGFVWDHVQTITMYRTNQLATQEIMAAALGPAGVSHLEDPRYADRLEVVRTDLSAFGLLFDFLAQFVGSTLSIVATLVVLAAIQPWLLLLVTAVTGVGIIGGIHRARQLDYIDRTLFGQRMAAELAGLATAAGPAKEVRVNGLGPWLLARHDEMTATLHRQLAAGEGRAAFTVAAGGIAEAALTVVGLVLIWQAAVRHGGLGVLALGAVALSSTIRNASVMGGQGADVGRRTYLARRYLWLRRHSPSVPVVAVPSPVPASLRQGIRFESVSFTYPGSDHPALRGLDLVLPAGATVALVGDNGAGKTTLVKLLLRMYDPTEGGIIVDGTDLRELDPVDWREACSGAFQDFLRPHLRAGQAVGIGHLRLSEDAGRVAGAAKRGGAAAVIEALSEGYGTQLGREFGGTDLSEGQWQRLAVSRSLMRREPLLVVLDEPTASLDPRAEFELFERYRVQVAEAKHISGVVVLVSHRFSTVTMADLIVAIDGGQVAEMGTHEELMAADGRYASLYRIQANRYS